MIPTKRIFIVHWARPPVGGGVESHLVDLANGLAARSHEVFVITGTRSDALEFDDSVQLVYSPDLNLFTRKVNCPSRLVGCSRTLEQLVSDLQPDIVHGHNLDHFGGGPLRALLMAKARKSCSLYTPRILCLRIPQAGPCCPSPTYGWRYQILSVEHLSLQLAPASLACTCLLTPLDLRQVFRHWKRSRSRFCFLPDWYLRREHS